MTSMLQGSRGTELWRKTDSVQLRVVQTLLMSRQHRPRVSEPTAVQTALQGCVLQGHCQSCPHTSCVWVWELVAVNCIQSGGGESKEGWLKAQLSLLLGLV